MSDNSNSAVLLAFLEQFVADKQAAAPKPLAAYQQCFPGYEAQIAAEYERLISGGAAPLTAEPDFQHFDNYRVIDKLGSGGQGIVYLAEDTRLGRRVALKVLTGMASVSVEGVSRFRREAEATSMLDHPGICRLYERGNSHGVPFLAMAYVQGQSLADRMALGEPMPIGTTLQLFEQAARALAAAHGKGIVHRDIKPANVMITPEGDPVLLDFGIARLLESDEQTLTHSGHMLGTPAYLSPEQITGDASRLDHRTDVYSLGVSLFEALTQQRPFQSPTREGLYQQILRVMAPDARTLNPAISRDVSVILQTALAKDADARYQSAEDFAEDLRRARVNEPILAQATSTARRVVLWAGRNRGWASTLVAAAVLLIMATIVAATYAVRANGLLVETQQLADKPLFDGLVATANEELRPPRPSRLHRFEEWLARARTLLARAPSHRQALIELRRRAIAQSDADRTRDRRQYALEYAALQDGERQRRLAGPLTPAAETYYARIQARVDQRYHYTFADADEQLRHDVLRDLTLSLERLGDHSVLNTNTIAAVTHRRDLAMELGQRLVGEDAEAWRWCSAHVASEPAYADVQIEAIPGLVPLGIDQDSGLIEFWHVTSGTKPEWQGTALGRGHVVLDATSGEEGMVLVLIPGGAFNMGAIKPDGEFELGMPNVDIGADGIEQPVHRVELAPFLLSKFEATRGQWRRMFGSEQRMRGPLTGAREPIAEQTWDQAIEACRRWDLVLPTEAQWEYACRARSTSPWHPGLTAKSIRGYANAGGATLAQRAIWQDKFETVAPVGALLANAFGLHDMHGNVSEWCRDGFCDYVDWPVRNGDGLRGYETGVLLRMHRSGSWQVGPRECRSSYRQYSAPDVRNADLGFRPARGLTVSR